MEVELAPFSAEATSTVYHVCLFATSAKHKLRLIVLKHNLFKIQIPSLVRVRHQTE